LSPLSIQYKCLGVFSMQNSISPTTAGKNTSF